MSNGTSEAWKQLQSFAFDDPSSSFPFSAKVAKENGWTRGYTLRVIEEYRRFAFLAIHADHPVSPSEAVDQAWHIHILYTRQYSEFCRDCLGKFLHHGPSRGGRKETDKFQDWYEKTLESYRAFFGEEPPTDIWPTPGERRDQKHSFQRIDRSAHWVVPKPKLRAAHLWFAAALVPFAFHGCAANEANNPLDFDGPSFLGFYVVSFLVAVVVAQVVKSLFRPPSDKVAGYGTLAAEEIAMLNGGKGLVGNSALACLLREGLVTITSRTVKATGAPEPPGLTPIQAKILHASAGQGVYAKTALDAIEPEVDSIRQRLTDQGLLLTKETRLQNAALSLLPIGLVMAVGIEKVIVGISRDRPVAFLIVLLVISTIVTLVFLANRPARSRKGDHVLNDIREGMAGFKAIATHNEASAVDYATAVALFGIPVLAGSPYFSSMSSLAPSGSTTNSGCGTGCGSSCSSSSSGGDGGSSCGGGGGCGGCGS